ncbi:cupin domain-containing protein [Pseudothauera rhizosphaerae]|uniref:Cupin domain-containing protein n=1 Tax=Pseudothauera rhizosphaerae TaxID=2565932 RepID=A0A4S4AY01_9RHOO|nr:cupin domain-containing protein [Pseudothauera rhizosphaerae]THF64208.1 cupin domain-containing protein [Pseudothauera rhizosphaerae]
MTTTLLGGLSPRQFLEEYWQKKPLLVRQALPGFTGVVSREELFDLACDPDVESRWVRHDGDTWEVEHGPQRRSRLRGKRTPWTVLVQGLNLWVPDGDELLHRFDFIPQARLDDLMVSYAVDGGGVGPHFDNYDVFLLQGIGKRRWRIGDQKDHSLVEGAPLRILKDFRPTHDWILEPGDLLYLPPHWAHDGIAVGECTTYSIGFRTPTAQELGVEFLGWMQERVCLDSVYADPDLAPQENSGQIPEAMVDQVAAMLRAIRWDRGMVADFLGEYLTEPKPHVFFDPPDEPLSAARFARQVGKAGYRLDARSVLLFRDGRFFLNGEAVEVPAAESDTLAQLAHHRRLPPGTAFSPALLALLHDWYRAGFGHPQEA